MRAVDDLLSPERFLTKICMVSSGSAEEAREETLEMLLERMMAVGVGVLVVIAVICELSRIVTALVLSSVINEERLSAVDKTGPEAVDKTGEAIAE